MVRPLISLPVGFRFSPTDEELVNHYLNRKISGHVEDEVVIAEIDVCKFEPWDLPEKSAIKNGDQEWYFLSPKHRKYPSGQRTNRATEAGFWKTTGRDRTIKSRKFGENNVIGSKKTLVFYRGRAPEGQKTGWIMHEYTSADNQGSYVLCRLFKQPETTIAIERSNDAKHTVESEMPSNQRNIEIGFQELPIGLSDEVNLVASHTVVEEGSNFTSTTLETEALILIESPNDAEHCGLSSSSTRCSPRELVSEIPWNQRNVELGSQEELSVQLADEVNSVVWHTAIQEESNFMSTDLDADAREEELYELLEIFQDIEEPRADETGNDESAIMHSVKENLGTEAPIPIESSNDAAHHGLSSSPAMSSPWGLVPEIPSNQRTIKLGLQNELPVQLTDEVSSVVWHTVIQDECIVTSESLDTDDCGAEITDLLDAFQDIEEPGAYETVNDEFARTHSNLEFLNENYESELFDSLFNFDDDPNHIMENRITETDFDSVTFFSSSSYHLRTAPSETQLIRHGGGDDHRIIYESSSEGLTNPCGETGIMIRSRHTRVPTSDLSWQHQGTAPRRILLQSKCLLDESSEKIQQPKLCRSGFALILVIPVLFFVYAGWKWFSG